MNALTKPVKVSISDLGGGHEDNMSCENINTHLGLLSIIGAARRLTPSTGAPGCSTATCTSTHGANVVHGGLRPRGASPRM